MRELLHYEVVEEKADAPWLVFIHGAGGSVRTWRFQIEALSPHYRLLLIDLRDHGFSKDIAPAYKAYDFDIIAHDILKVVDHLEINKAHFLSLSIGSVVLQKLDIERPELMEKMVMAGAIFDGSWLMHAFVHSAKALNHVFNFRTIYWLFSWIVLPRRNHRLSRFVFRRQSRRLTNAEYLKWVELYKPFFKLIKEYMERPVTRKGLVVMGNQDHIFFGASARFCEIQKEVQLVVIENCGHVCSIEAPDEFNALVLKFLAGEPLPARVVAKPVPVSWKELKAMRDATPKGKSMG